MALQLVRQRFIFTGGSVASSTSATISVGDQPSPTLGKGPFMLQEPEGFLKKKTIAYHHYGVFRILTCISLQI